MDCGWDGLENKVVETSLRFKNEMLEIVAHSPNRETQELINQDTMRRFVDLARTMSEGLEWEAIISMKTWKIRMIMLTS